MTQWDNLYNTDHSFISSIEPLSYFMHACPIESIDEYRVLDLGCGVGAHTVELARVGYRMEGIDISSEAINIAKKNSKKCKNANFSVGTMSHLPFPNDCFNAVLSLRVINHGTFNDLKLTVNEIWRVLKKHGQVILTVQKNKFSNQTNGRTILNNMPINIIGLHEYIPLEGGECGITHFAFTKKTLLNLFHEFHIKTLKVINGNKSWDRYYLLHCEKEPLT